MIDKVKIGWKTYKVESVEPKQTLFIEGKECYGTIDYDKQQIDLSTTNSNALNEVTLIHEVLHGIEDMYYLDLGEETVKRLAEAIYTVLKDNNLDIVKQCEKA
ncbi:hypothetical protein CS063_01495 [Sporanaerobium hydrogeniformans]|uniref:Uncharacterized protein n=1 Tax=Sporanaerobium hydrogeniformans TaxID=3072179 RepID=A0AC61DHT7_9FIRM|nr:hypothetical protein [Sporanaerobium hydrogeniformans]PHV72176.1 hypothetical protein CS063_01495 [Sporanaerobium hydrogeniformans]